MIKNYFISSTFRDMQAERDVIKNKVLPSLKIYSNAKGFDVTITDLRWGISTAELDTNESMNKILSVCMREIDNCLPHIIILLGDVYGSIPSDNAMNALLTGNQKNKLTSADIMGKSVTELEIIYGLLNRVESNHSVTICMRKHLPYEQMNDISRNNYCSQKDEDIDKLNSLKEELINKYSKDILYYEGQWNTEKQCVMNLDTFEKQLTERLIKQLGEEFPYIPKSKEGIQWNSDNLLKKQYNQLFIGRQSFLQDINEFVDNPNENLMVIRGNPGSGKSSLVSRCSTMFFGRAEVVMLFCGNGVFLSNGYDILVNLVWRLEKIVQSQSSFNEDNHSFAEWKQEAHRLVDIITKDKKLLIIVDGLDQLQNDSYIEKFDFLPQPDIHNNYKLILTAINEYKLPQNILYLQSPYSVTINQVEDDELINIINNHLLYYRKELSLETLELVVSITRYHSPLYISLIIDRINMMTQTDYQKISSLTKALGSSDKAFVNYFKEILGVLPQEEEMLAVELFKIAGDNLKFKLVPYVLAIIASAYDGFRAEDILGILSENGYSVTPLELSVFVRLMDRLFRTGYDGRINFSHNLIRKGVENLYGHIIEDNKPVVFKYLCALDNMDPIKTQEFAKYAFFNNKPLELAKYLAVVYYDETKLLREKKIDSTLRTNMLITSLRKLLFDSRDSEKNAIEFVELMVNHAANESAYCFNGVCCAFLFTFDVFFTDNFGLKYRLHVMNLLHQLSMQVLYPVYNDDPEYLRTVYVCCEQCGIRADNYDYMCDMYFKFNMYCIEMYNFIDYDYTYRVQILRDLSISYSKLASLYEKRNWRKALELYDIAIEITKKPHKDKEWSYILYDEAMEDAAVKAECIIQKAVQNQNIGWEMDAEMESLLLESERNLYEYETHILNKGNINYYKLGICYKNLSDFYGVLCDNEMQLKYTLKFLECTERNFRAKGDIISRDYLRNAYFRIADSNNFNLEIKERIQYINIAYYHAMEIYKQNKIEVAEKIVMVCSQTLLKLNYENIKKIWDSIDLGNINDLNTLCMQVLNKVNPVLPILFSSDDGEENYEMVIETMSKTAQCSNILKRLSVQALNNKEYNAAINYADSAYNSWFLLKDQLEDSIWYLRTLDLCTLIRVCYHNRFVNELNHRKTDDCSNITKSEEYYISLIFYYCLEYRVKHGKNQEILDYEPKINMLQISELAIAKAWLQLAANFLGDKAVSTKLWEHIENINYKIPGQRNVYLMFKNSNDASEVKRYVEKIGKYICNNLSNEKVKTLIYKSDLIESSALEYAYRHDMINEANIIIENGYDRYLELPFLYIMRKYNRMSFLKYINELKDICLSRHLSVLKKGIISRYIGKAFCEELKEIIYNIIESRRSST